MGVETWYCPGTPDAEDDKDRSRFKHDDQPAAGHGDQQHSPWPVPAGVA